MVKQAYRLQPSQQVSNILNVFSVSQLEPHVSDVRRATEPLLPLKENNEKQYKDG